MNREDKRKQRTAGLIDVRVDGSGFAVEGPGFYVWDEDLEAVLGAARELSRGRFPVTTRVQRALLVPRKAGPARPVPPRPSRRRRPKSAGPGTPTPAP